MTYTTAAERAEVLRTVRAIVGSSHWDAIAYLAWQGVPALLAHIDEVEDLLRTYMEGDADQRTYRAARRAMGGE